MVITSYPRKSYSEFYRKVHVKTIDKMQVSYDITSGGILAYVKGDRRYFIEFDKQDIRLLQKVIREFQNQEKR